MAQITLIMGRERRRRWSEDERRRILALSFMPGAIVSQVARQCEVSKSLLYKWRQDALKAEPARQLVPAMLAAEPAPSAPPPSPDTASIVVEFSNGAQCANAGGAGCGHSGRTEMSPIASNVRIWLATGHTDMRCDMHRLALLVQEGLGREPFGGDSFIFRGRSGKLIKAIWHDGVGFSLYSKRLDRGRFVWPQTIDGVVSLTPGQMSYRLEAIDWRNPQHTWRPQIAG